MSGPWPTAGVNGVANLFGTMVPRGCVCGNRGRRTHNGYPRGSGGSGDEGTMRWHSLVHLCRWGGGPLRPEGCATCRHTQWFMMIPVVASLVVPLPSVGHRQFGVAGLASGHHDSGGAAIMGPPLPHIVLPQDSLLMYTLLFLSLDWSSIWCVLARWWAGHHLVRATSGTSL